MKLSRIVLGLSALFVLGCGGPPSDQPELVDVSGTVTLNGEPLANVLVQFVPDSKGRPATGTTDESGKYTLQYTADYPGVPAGAYSVTVSKQDSEEDYEDGGDGTANDDAESGLPDTAMDGSIKKTVEAGGGTIDIAL